MSAPNQLSFLPDDYMADKAQARTNMICLALFVAVALGVAVAFTLQDRSLRRVEEARAVAAAHFAESARPIEQFHQMQAKQRQVASQAELTASLLEKVPRSRILASITNALPGGTSLLEMAMNSKLRPPKTPTTPTPQTQFQAKAAALQNGGADAGEQRQYDVSIKITGMADTDVQVAAFIKSLSNSPLFKDVNLVISDEFQHEKQTLRRFQIEMTLNANAEAEPVSNRKDVRTAALETR